MDETREETREEMRDAIDAASLNEALIGTGTAIGFEVLDQCDSTNSLLLERARLESARGGSSSAIALVCEHQTGGRGRRGTRWLAAPGASLTFSLLWRFDAAAGQVTGLSLAVAVAVAKAIESLGGVGVGLKWPNDLLFEGRKLGGILIESLAGQDGMAVVIGIGLNVRPSPSLPAETAMPMAYLREAGVRAARTMILATVLEQLAAMLDEFAHNGFAPLREEWMSRHAWQGRHVVLSDGGRACDEGDTLGVAEDGALLVQCGEVVKRFYSGELSLRTA